MAKRFGPYTVQTGIGKGASGTVYRAEDEASDKTVALKILHAEVCAQPGVLARFEKEIPALAQRLAHAHILRIQNFGVLNTRAYLETSYMAAGSLAARLQKPTEQNSQQSIRLLRHIADALDFAHRQGIYHHGLTLHNILLNDRADAVVSDFGLRLIVGGIGNREAFTAGTGPYSIAPEQIRSQASPNHRADLYALAAIAYALLVGRWPFYGEPATVLKAHLQGDVPPPSRVNPDLPPALDAVLLRALAKRPDDRYTSGDMLVEAIARTFQEPIVTAINLWETPAPQTTAPQLTTIELKSLAQTADDFYRLAQAARREQDSIAYLKRALELDPFHADANRMLFKLEGAKPATAPDRAFQPAVEPAAPFVQDVTAPLKKVRNTPRRTAWNYVAIFGFVAFALTGVYVVALVTGNAGKLVGLLTGQQAVTEIEGTPIRDVPDAILTIEPQQSRELTKDGTAGDTLSDGYSHEYFFNVVIGRELYVYVQFLSLSAKNVRDHVAVLRPDGSNATPGCETDQILRDGSSIAFICPANQSGQWTVRIIGIEGESTGAYVVSASQG